MQYTPYDASDRHVCGLALESLAFRLMHVIDLPYIANRLCSTMTGVEIRPAAVVDVFRCEALHPMDLKKLELQQGLA